MKNKKKGLIKKIYEKEGWPGIVGFLGESLLLLFFAVVSLLLILGHFINENQPKYVILVGVFGLAGTFFLAKTFPPETSCYKKDSCS